MDEIKQGRNFDKLMRRKNEIKMTLLHLEKEQKEVDENNDWIDRAAYQRRVDLLDQLTEWYLKEIAHIEKVVRHRCLHQRRQS